MEAIEVGASPSGLSSQQGCALFRVPLSGLENACLLKLTIGTNFAQPQKSPSTAWLFLEQDTKSRVCHRDRCGGRSGCRVKIADTLLSLVPRARFCNP